jgi:hypothetical protein
MMKCTECGGNLTVLFSSSVCENPGCGNYKPPTGKVVWKDVLKNEVQKATTPSNQLCIACAQRVMINPHADTWCNCGVTIINEDVRALLIGNIQRICVGSPNQTTPIIKHKRAVFINETSQICAHKFRGHISADGHFLYDDGLGRNDRINIKPEDWFNNPCKEENVHLELRDHVVLLRQLGTNVWKQMANGSGQYQPYWLYLFGMPGPGCPPSIRIFTSMTYDSYDKIFG